MTLKIEKMNSASPYLGQVRVRNITMIRGLASGSYPLTPKKLIETMTMKNMVTQTAGLTSRAPLQ